MVEDSEIAIYLCILDACELINVRSLCNSRSWAACKTFCFASGKSCCDQTYHPCFYVNFSEVTAITFGALLLNPSSISESILQGCFLICQVLQMDHRSGQAF